ncbi:transcriptional regulator [Kitasatospora indigofera]|uniref:Transcriptional regulator n=1 Tax=Kitasatospora indigofera TaxID=67307 RepID=A0A919GDY6_9ACTN|nr:helix-turn-helix domain-containing protein [Kitasatospora indigofera]GHH82671.1 transcriptional regulator [Kitasatospora indigofera]
MRQTRRHTRRPAGAAAAPAPGGPDLAAVHDAATGGGLPADGGPEAGPRPEIGDSWARLRRLGLDPDRGAAAVHLGPAEVEHRRRASGLDEVIGILRDSLLDSTGDCPLILAIADAEGHVLWHEGERQLRRSADRIGFLIGARWVEENVGTNGIGTALRAGRPMQVHSAEHYLRSHHAWTCFAAPVHEPRTGRLAGVINISAPAQHARPYLLQLTMTAARLAEAELRARRLEALHQLRTVATPLLAKVNGPALVVDGDGWTAAAAGLPPTDRLRLPAEGWGSASVHWLPSLGECAVEPLADGWLVRPVRSPGQSAPGDRSGVSEQTEGARLRLDLRRPDRPELSVEGAAGTWSHGLSPRHAELLLLLATHRDGRSAAQLAEALFGDPARTVTVRAELSRLRRYLGGLLAHRPYRFAPTVTVGVAGPDDPYDLLPGSTAPAVRRLRSRLAAGTVRLPAPPDVARPPAPVRPPEVTVHPDGGHPPVLARPRVS